MANRTITTIVVFIFILTHILCLYDAIASCGYNDDAIRKQKLNEAMVDLAQKKATEIEREKDYRKAEKALNEFNSNSSFFDEVVFPIAEEGWWKLIGGGLLFGPGGIIAGSTWEFLTQMHDAFETIDRLRTEKNNARLDWVFAGWQTEAAQKKFDALNNHEVDGGTYNDDGCNDGGCNERYSDGGYNEPYT